MLRRRNILLFWGEMFYRYLLNPFGSYFLLVSLCLSLASVLMTSLLVRVVCWSLPLSLCRVQCVFWALVKFLVWMWVHLHLGHIYVQNWDFILVDFFPLSMKYPSQSLLITFDWKPILLHISLHVLNFPSSIPCRARNINFSRNIV